MVWKQGWWHPYFTALAGLGAIGYLIYSILTSTLPEAQKLFAVNIVLLLCYAIYVESSSGGNDMKARRQMTFGTVFIVILLLILYFYLKSQGILQ